MESHPLRRRVHRDVHSPWRRAQQRPCPADAVSEVVSDVWPTETPGSSGLCTENWVSRERDGTG